LSTWLRMGYGVLSGIVRRIMSGVKLGDALPQHWAETDPDAYPQKERGQEWVMRSECHTHHVFLVRKPAPGNLTSPSLPGRYIRHRDG
jgi:hypothetical protein